MINTLQQIKDEWAKGDNFHNWDDLFDSCAKYDYERLESAIDEVAIRYAQEQNKELVEMLKECMRVLNSVQSPATPSILLRREIESLINSTIAE